MKRLRNRCQWLPALLLFLGIASWPTELYSQSPEIVRKKLRLTLASAVDSIRSQSPILLDANLAWSSPRLLEGRLRLEFYVDSTHRGTWISQEVALSDGELPLRLMLPPALIPDEDFKYTVRAEFLTEDHTIFLGDYDVAVPIDPKRILIAGIVHPFDLVQENGSFKGPDERPFALQDSLRLETNPGLDVRARDLSCRVVSVLPGDLPRSPLEFVMFDLLIVSDAGFDRLGPEQLTPLADWVEAGGRVCLVSGHADTSAHQACLRRLLEDSPLNPVLQLDGDRELRLLRPHAANWRRGTPGVGRAIVSTEPIDVRSRDWAAAVYWLWGIRADQKLPETSDPSRAVVDDEPDENMFDFTYRFSPDPLAAESALGNWLIPDTIEGVPFSTVCVLLGLCLLAVAPGDYLLLGWLRRRRWTWILFPSVAVAFTLLTMKIAQSHIGQTDSLTSLEFVDLTADGRIARTSSFELTFANTSKTRSESFQSEYVTPFEYRASASSDSFTPGFRYNRTGRVSQFSRYDLEDELSGKPFVYAGRVPTRYSVTRQLEQWSPQLQRRTAFTGEWAPNNPAARIPWSEATFDQLRTETGFQEWAAKVRRDLPDAWVAVVSSRSVQSTQPLEQQQSASRNRPPLELVVDPATGEVTPLAESETFATRLEQAAHTALQASARDETGLFQLVAQIAPNAAGNFEDLALLDRTDDSALLLLVVTESEAGRFQVYRRLLHEAP